MACRCQRSECTCRDCTTCKNIHCRCCADSALAVLPPDDLVHAHNAHVAALAHLELALAALSGSATEKLSWTDWAKQKVKAAQDAVKAGAATLKKATYDDNKKAMGAVLYKIVKPIANTTVGRAIANSRGVKSIGDAIKAGSKENTTATAEHDAHDKEFERRRKEEKALAAQQAAQQQEDKTARTSTKSEHSPPKIGHHGYEIGTSNEFRLADRQIYLITKGPFDVDIEEENRRRKFEEYLRKHKVDEDTIMILRRHGVEEFFDLKAADLSRWNDLSDAGKKKLQHVKDLNNDYADVHWKRDNKGH